MKRIYGDFAAPSKFLMEEGAATIRYQAGSTVCVHDRKERHGQHADHREEGLTVLGLAKRKHRRRSADNSPPRIESGQESLPTQAPAEAIEPKPEFPKKFVLTALEQSIDDAGWANLATFGSYLTKLQPDFDSRLYGYKKLSDLVKAEADLFVTEERQVPGSNQKVLYLRANSFAHLRH